MSVRPIYLHPHPVLREISAPVTDFGPELHQLMNDLLDTTRAAERGAGLAAIQIGVKLRAMVIDARLADVENYNTLPPKLVEFINPTLTARSDAEQEWEMGCLSIPDFYAVHHVPAQITITAQDRHGNTFTTDAAGYYAAGILHEMDHLDGILFPDHLSRMKKNLLWERYKKRIKRIEQDLRYPFISGA